MQDTTTSTSGTIEDVASFFCRAVDTIREWVDKDLISCYKISGKLVFGEETVIECRAKLLQSCRPLKPGEAQAIAKREWREHLQVRSEAAVTKTDLEQLSQRLEILERTLLAKEAA